MIRFQTESFDEAYADMAKTFEAAFDELEREYAPSPPEPNESLYRAMEDNNALVIVTARDEGELVGFLDAVLGPMLHYKDRVIATVDFIYVAPSYRGKGVGERLLRWLEDIVAERGATGIMVTMKEGLDHPRMFDGLGYRAIERTFHKRLN